MGETIEISLTFNQDVDMEGEPTLSLSLDEDEVAATYRSGSGSDTLVFGFDVQASDRDSDGIALPVQRVEEFGGGGSIQAFGADADATGDIPGFESQDGHAVAGEVYVTSISVSSDPEDDNTYETGDTIEVSVEFDDEVTVTGTPQLALNFDGTAKNAEFRRTLTSSDDDSGDETSTGGVLVFVYTAQEGDEDADGILVIEDGLSLNGGSIESHNGESADLAHASVSAEGHLVGEVPPEFESAKTSEDGKDIIVKFSEDVQIAPELQTVVANAGLQTHQARGHLFGTVRGQGSPGSAVMDQIFIPEGTPDSATQRISP